MIFIKKHLAMAKNITKRFRRYELPQKDDRVVIELNGINTTSNEVTPDNEVNEIIPDENTTLKKNKRNTKQVENNTELKTDDNE